MEPIIINPSDVWQIVLAVCGGVITLSGAGAVLASIIHKIRAPNKKQDERIAALEEKCGKIEERLVLGNKRFESDAGTGAGRTTMFTFNLDRKKPTLCISMQYSPTRRPDRPSLLDIMPLL